MVSLYRTLLLSTTPLTKVPIFECACVLYRNYNTTPIIAPSNPFVRSMGSKRYTIMNLLFEFLAHHLKWSRVATCKWNHKYPSCHCLLVLQPCNKLCPIAVWVCRQPEVTRAAAVTLHMTSSLLIQPFAATILRSHHQTYSSSVSLHCLRAVMFPNFFLVLH